MVIQGQSYAAGEAEGAALVLADPLSFWGGIDVMSGRVIDRSHPDLGRRVTNRMLVMPGGRGSSSAASVLAETIRRRTGPAGIVLTVPDPILTVGALVAQFLYGLRCPIVVSAIDGIATGDRVRIRAQETGPAEVAVDPIPLTIEFAPGTTLLVERDRPSQFPILGNGPPGTFVLLPGGLRVSLPTDQIVFTEDDGGRARVGFGGMSFEGIDGGRLAFRRVRELHPDERLSPDRSHLMTLDPVWVGVIYAEGRAVWPVGADQRSGDRDRAV